MLCPADGTSLMVRDVGPHIGYVCASCRGAWLPKHYVESLRYTYAFSIDDFFAELARARTGVSATLHCPTSRHPLSEVRRDDRLIAWCAACQGVWFERDALPALLAKLERLEPGTADYGKGLAVDFGVTSAIAFLLGL